jgi:hypothetical protein
MTSNFEERLNQILPRLTSPELLKNQGLGNEIGFWIFDYPAEEEMAMRDFRREVIEPNLKRLRPNLRFASIDLFDFVINYIEERGLLDKAFAKQLKEGDEALLGSLRPILKEDRLAPRLVEKTNIAELDLLILHGVGAVYPLLRTHTLLSALHPHMQDTPLLMLYPGVYDGTKLKLFNQLSDDNYYRAFSLVS